MEDSEDTDPVFSLLSEGDGDIYDEFFELLSIICIKEDYISFAEIDALLEDGDTEADI